MACLGGMSVAVWLESCSTAYYSASFSKDSGRIVIKKSEFIQIKNDKESTRKFVLVQVSEFEHPVCVFKLDADNYSAVLMKCTHNGCGLKPLGNYLVCPCHGSEFNNRGVVQNPPAEQNLRSFQVTTDHEYIYLAI